MSETSLSVVVSGHRVACGKCGLNKVYDLPAVDDAIHDYLNHECPGGAS